MENIKKDEIIVKLQTRLGFTVPEADAYYYMLLSDVTAANLANLLNINRSYAYGLLKKLMTLGFCTEIPGTVRQYRAVEPNLAFKTVIEESEQKLVDLKQLNLDIQPLFEQRKQTASNDMVKVLHSRAHILDTLKKYEMEAKEEIVAFSKPPYLMDDSNVEGEGNSQSASSSRGVLHKSIYEIETGDVLPHKVIKYFINAGEEVRIAQYLPMKLVVFDSQKVVFTLEKNPGKKEDITFTFFNDESLAKTFRMIFQTYWDSSLTYEEYLRKLENNI